MVSLRSRSMHVHGLINMIIDTGSTISFISEGDAFRLHIPMSKLKSEGIAEVGGCTSMLYELKKVVLSFKNEKGKIEKIDLPAIYVLKSTKRDKKNLALSRSLPSAIGVDFLKSQKFDIRTEITKNIAYLEKI